jgi:hypothetical protein
MRVGYPFRQELDSSDFPKHRLNLIFSLNAEAERLVAQGFKNEAKKLLAGALLIEPNCKFVSEFIDRIGGA